MSLFWLFNIFLLFTHCADSALPPHEDFQEINASILSEEAENVSAGGNGSLLRHAADSLGRQLVDITAKASAGSPMKNGALQRDEKIKITKGSSVFNGNINFEKDVVSNRAASETLIDNTTPWHDPPALLVSNDCEEMKNHIKERLERHEDKDMELKEKDSSLYKKVTALESDKFLKQIKEISHNNDKSRRAVNERLNLNYDYKDVERVTDTIIDFNILDGDNNRLQIFNDNFALGKKSLLNSIFIDNLNLEKDITNKATSDSTAPWHEPPSLLVSDDCEEMKIDIKEPIERHEGKDMELKEKDASLYRKVIGLESDKFLQHGKAISHIHSNDKARRAVKERLKLNYDYKEAEGETTTSVNFELLERKVNNNKMHISNERFETTQTEDVKYSPDKEEEVGEKDEKSYAWKGRQRSKDSTIRFGAGPPREKYIVPSLKISEGTFIFRFLSGFFGFLHPFNFPTELLRDVLWNTVSVPQLILQSIRVEVGFIIAIILGLMASLAVPAYGFCVSVLMLFGKKRSKFDQDTPSPGAMEEEDCGDACERRILMVLMQMLLLISVFGIGVMVIGNEFANNGAGLTGNGLRAAGRDLSAYIHATHRDLVHVLLDSADQTIAAADQDLDRVDFLLGEPIQKAIAVETGIDVAFDALADIAAVSAEISTKVLALGSDGSRAVSMAMSAKERLRELRRQLDAARDNCAKADRPLCDTIDTNGLDLVIKFEMVSEQRLGPLIGALGAQNLSNATEFGRLQFNDIPKAVANQSKAIINDVREALLDKRAEMLRAERSLAKVVRHLSSAVSSTTRHINQVILTIDAIEFWRWFFFLIAIILMSIVIVLISIALFFGCCGAESYSSCLLKSSVIIMCLLAIPMWFLVIVIFAVGGHGEVFLCRPLYEEPDFNILGKLIDNPGMLYKENNGLFKQILSDLDDIHIDQSFRNILRECKENRPAYPVFHLSNVLNLNAETAYFNWSRLESAKDKLKNRNFSLNLATPNVQTSLNDIMSQTSVNITDYRMQLNGPITGKDLTSLADQLESIANQNSDLSTSSRIETLASRTRRVVINNIQPLEQLRTELVYKLTELELQLQPFQRQMNQSLSHLKTIQYYIDNQGGVIAEKKTQDYVKRLTGYLEQYRGHVLDQVEKHVGLCRPIWDVFDAGRTLVCRHYIDSLNGYWLGLSVSLFLWIGMAPLALKLRRSFKRACLRKSGLLLRTISHQNSSENAVISEQSAWSTPGEPPQDN